MNMNRQRIEISKKRILICEGPIDFAFFSALTKVRSIDDLDVFSVGDLGAKAGGKDSFPDVFDALVALSGLSDLLEILCVVDADDDPQGARQQMENVIRDASKKFEAAGCSLIIAGKDDVQNSDRLKILPVKIVIVPTDDQAGCLETLLWDVVEQKYPDSIKCIKDYLECMDASNWSDGKKAKAKIRSFIAGHHKRNPDMSLYRIWEQSNSADIIPLSHPIFNAIAASISVQGLSREI
jgi:hypothetical protein